MTYKELCRITNPSSPEFIENSKKTLGPNKYVNSDDTFSNAWWLKLKQFYEERTIESGAPDMFSYFFGSLVTD